MDYVCYWVGADGKKNWEGTFTVEGETLGQLKMRRTEADGYSKFPDMKEISLPKEGYNTTTNFVKNPQYWDGSIQVHLGDFPYAFIFEPTKL